MSKPHLISFDLCPYVQRSVITLQEKNVDYDITYIDLSNKPDWFLKISPFGKVPVMQIGDDVLFESAVINEYLDETTPPSMHPADALAKAQNRAWIEFGSSLLGHQYKLANAQNEADCQAAETALTEALSKLENVLGDGPFFNGATFSLIDAAYAPFFLRLNLLQETTGRNWTSATPKAENYMQALCDRPSTQSSVPEGFADKYAERLQNRDSWLISQRKAA